MRTLRTQERLREWSILRTEASVCLRSENVQLSVLFSKEINYMSNKIITIINEKEFCEDIKLIQDSSRYGAYAYSYEEIYKSICDEDERTNGNGGTFGLDVSKVLGRCYTFECVSLGVYIYKGLTKL